MNWPHLPHSDIAFHLETLYQYASNCTSLLEIGTRFGDGSTMAFDIGMRENPRAVTYVSVDIQDQLKFRPKFLFWRFIIGDSASPKTVEKVSDKFDLVFIDTDHTYTQMMCELLLWHPLTLPSCIWLFHDTYLNGKYNHMTDSIKEFASWKNLEYSDLTTQCHGLGLMKEKT